MDAKLKELAKRMREDAQGMNDPRAFFAYATELDNLAALSANGEGGAPQDTICEFHGQVEVYCPQCLIELAKSVAEDAGAGAGVPFKVGDAVLLRGTIVEYIEPNNYGVLVKMEEDGDTQWVNESALTPANGDSATRSSATPDLPLNPAASPARGEQDALKQIKKAWVNFHDSLPDGEYPGLGEMRMAMAKQDAEICQILGKALGYPWYKDDQKNFPGATEADGVCVGDNVAESLAMEAAGRLDDEKGNSQGKQLEGMPKVSNRKGSDSADMRTIPHETTPAEKIAAPAAEGRGEGEKDASVRPDNCPLCRHRYHSGHCGRSDAFSPSGCRCEYTENVAACPMCNSNPHEHWCTEYQRVQPKEHRTWDIPYVDPKRKEQP